MYMAELHSYYMDPHAHGDTKWNNLNGKKSAKINVEINTNVVIRSNSKVLWLKKISKYLSSFLLLYSIGLNVYIYLLHIRLFVQQSDLSNAMIAVNHLIDNNDFAFTKLNNLEKEIIALKRFSENVVPTIIIENSPNVVGRNHELLSGNFGPLNDVGRIVITGDNFIAGNQSSLIEHRQKRGAKRSNNRRCRCRQDDKRENNWTKQQEFAAVHFLGSNLQVEETVAGIMGPWFNPVYSTEELSSLGINMINEDRMVEVMKKGMYFIYAQVHYCSKNKSNTFSINKISVSNGRDTVIAVCSKDNTKSTAETEISCHTSLIYYLDSEDRIYIRLRDTSRRINYHKGYTFFGLFPISAKLPTPELSFENE